MLIEIKNMYINKYYLSFLKMYTSRLLFSDAIETESLGSPGNTGFPLEVEGQAYFRVPYLGTVNILYSYAFIILIYIICTFGVNGFSDQYASL